MNFKIVRFKCPFNLTYFGCIRVLSCRRIMLAWLTQLGAGKDFSDPADNASSSKREKNLDETGNQISLVDPQQRQLQLNRIVSNGLKRAEQKGTYNIAGHAFDAQEQIAQVAELLEWAKDWIDGAVQASPQASIAWTVIALGLPLLTKPAAAEQANLDGFTYVTSRMEYYVEFESSILPQRQAPTSYAIPEGLRKKVEEHITSLYQHILNYQIKSVLRFYRSVIGNVVQDIFQGKDWKQMRKDIEDIEKILNAELEQINDSTVRKILENLSQIADASQETQQQLLEIAEQHRQISKENLDIAAKQLSVQERILRKLEANDSRALSQDEKKCLQLFRLQTSNEDESYEWYKGRVEDQIEGTCQWFLDQKHFSQWMNQDSGLLLVSADPGCGKSVLAKYLIDSILPQRTSSTICYFFFKDQVQSSLRQALCAMIHQLFSFKPRLIRHAMPKYSTNGPNLVTVTKVLWDVLHDAANDPDTGPVIFVIDALDECNESDFKELARMLRTQLNGTKNSPYKIRYLLTSRPYEPITTEFVSLTSRASIPTATEFGSFANDFPYIHIPGEKESDRIGQEINCVIKYRVNQLSGERGLNKEVTNHLEQKLLAIPHRTYIWVYLVFDYLKQGFKKTKKGVEVPITSLPESVNQAYDKILSKSRDQQKLRKILSIILAATRPLTLREMNVAVNVETSAGSTCTSDLDLEQEDDFVVTLRNWCGLFVSIYQGKVHFLHQTAREFLIPKLSALDFISKPSHWHGSIDLQQAHLVLAEICMIYLEFNDLLSISNLDNVDRREKYPRGEEGEEVSFLDGTRYLNRHAFLEYSVRNWTLHSVKLVPIIIATYYLPR